MKSILILIFDVCTFQFNEFQDLLVGSLALKDGQKIVEGFSLHYRLLKPKNNLRNFWFKEFWKQVCIYFIPKTPLMTSVY